MGLRIVGGHFRGRILKVPKGQTTRPTSDRLREAFFNSLGPRIEKAHFLDLFAGSGAMALEALSRGARHATLIEQSKEAFRVIKENIKTLGLEGQTTLLFGDAYRHLPKLKGPFDIVYIDPPYKTSKEDYIKLISAFDGPDIDVYLEESQDLAQLFKAHPWKALELIRSKRYGLTHLHRLKHKD